MFCCSRTLRILRLLGSKIVTNFSSTMTEPRVRTVVSTVRGGGGAAAASPLISPHSRHPPPPTAATAQYWNQPYIFETIQSSCIGNNAIIYFKTNQ